MPNDAIKLKISKDIVVIYHGECSDGFGGAWAAWKKFGEMVDYVGAHHGDEPPAGLVGKDIYFIDFVYPKQLMESLKKENKRIVIIDHHKTAVEVLDLADEKLFEINHSGAVLSWWYFHPDKIIPSILRHIEARDIWRWEFDDSREILASFDLLDRDFKVWDEAIGEFDGNETKRKEFIVNGALLVRQWDNLCEDIMKEDIMEVEFEGYRTYSVNVSSVFSSDLGNLLSKKLPPLAITWHQGNDGNFRVSLRSDGTLDVAEIAKKYGGGGHRAAAGFRIMVDQPFPWKVIKSDN